MSGVKLSGAQRNRSYACGLERWDALLGLASDRREVLPVGPELAEGEVVPEMTSVDRGLPWGSNAPTSSRPR